MALFRKKAPLSRTEVLETPDYGWIWKPLVAVIAIYLLICIVLGIWWSSTPSPTDPREAVQQQRGFPQAVDTGEGSQTPPSVAPGEALVATNLVMLNTLLDKPGGYLRNDVMPPGLWLDNMPSWEIGVTQQVQDAVSSLQDSLEVGASPLGDAAEALSGNLNSWRWPASEKVLLSARNNLGEAFSIRENSARAQGAADQQEAGASSQASAPDTQALSSWLEVVQQRLDAQTLRLVANVGQSPSGDESRENTPWLLIDNVFFEARGTTWALAQLMQAAKIDYADTLEQSEAGETMDQLIAELEASQASLWSPMILNGTGFGLFANHSLMMANYTQRSAQLAADIRDQL